MAQDSDDRLRGRTGTDPVLPLNSDLAIHYPHLVKRLSSLFGSEQRLHLLAHGAALHCVFVCKFA